MSFKVGTAGAVFNFIYSCGIGSVNLRNHGFAVQL